MSPKLSELNPKDVAREVCSRVVDHMHRVAFGLMPTVNLHLPGAEGRDLIDALASESNLGLTVQTLTQYAQRGLPAWDWETSGEASDACLDVFSALYTSAGAPELGGGITDMADDVEPDDAIGVVLLAALARIKLDQRAPLTFREVAVLAGISYDGVAKQAQRGELEAHPEPGDDRAHPRMVVAPAVAKRWLGARGVAGFASKGEARP
jgi:hypothetical protein